MRCPTCFEDLRIEQPLFDLCMHHASAGLLRLSQSVARRTADQLHRVSFRRSSSDGTSPLPISFYHPIISNYPRMYRTHEERTSADAREESSYSMLLHSVQLVNNQVRLIRLRKKNPTDHVEARLRHLASTLLSLGLRPIV